MALTMPPRMLVQSEGRFQERKKLTMVKAPAYLKAGKTKEARRDVAEEAKERLLATRAELDMTTLLHEIFLWQNQLDEIARRRQPLVIKKRGSYATISGKFTT